MPLNARNLSLSEMKAALRAMEGGVTVEHLTAIQQFIEEIGGVENANAAVTMLLQMEAARRNGDAA